MCSHQEWERFASRFGERVDEQRVREFVADALAEVETLIEELKARSCAPERGDWGRHRRRSRPEWVA